MLFDAHTHLARAQDVGGDFARDGVRAWGDSFMPYCDERMHREAMKQCDGAIVLALDAPQVGYTSSNELVARYVREAPGRLFGFASVDPNRDDALQRLRQAIYELGLVGLKLGPVYQKFSPLDPIAMPLYALCQDADIPILWHQGTSFVGKGPLELCSPVLLDAIARSFPNVKMIIAHLGHPWCAETACLIRKHPNLYADISALGCRPWQFYNAMIAACEYGVTEKLFFGTDLPTFDVNTSVAQLRNINALCEGTNLPQVPDAVIEGILARDVPGILGLV